jgi:dipeptidyl-peptidase-4
MLAFDHGSLANAITVATKQSFTPYDIYFDEMTIGPSGQVYFGLFGYRWSYDPVINNCEKLEKIADNSFELNSPNDEKSVFVRENNLWLKDTVTGEEQALTVDGAENYGYAALTPAGLPKAIWSPDSKHLFTFQYDSRGSDPVDIVSYVPTNTEKTPFLSTLALTASVAGETFDDVRLVVINLESSEVRPVNYPNLCLRDDFNRFSTNVGWWSSDSQSVYFLDKSVDHKIVRLVESDIHTGATRVVFEESSDTFVRIRHELGEMSLFRPLPQTNEVIWYSERSGSGHLYLYNLETGALKNPITDGNGVVREVLHYDERRRELLLSIAARDPDISPYYRGLYKVNIDSGELTALVEGPFDHTVACADSVNVGQVIGMMADCAGIDGIAPSGDYILITRSRVDTIPENILIDRQGREIITVETADVSGLPGDWVWPEPVMLKADDGQTDLAGIVFRPPGFSSNQSYPIVDFSSTTRCQVQFPHGSFSTGAILGVYYYRAAALAALGFIVIMIEGRATPLRDKKFQDHGHGDFSAANELKDHIAGMRQLAERYPYMDLNRVGITGLEGFSNIVFSLLKYSDFYKVAAVHYQEDCWDYPVRIIPDEWYGTADDALRAQKKHPSDYVESFDGKLLLTEGMRTMSLANTFSLIEALQKANKDFDQLFLPTLGYRGNGYNYRREWDYLVRHLQGIEPPKEFSFGDGIAIVEADYREKIKKKNDFIIMVSDGGTEKDTVDVV